MFKIPIKFFVDIFIYFLIKLNRIKIPIKYTSRIQKKNLSTLRLKFSFKLKSKTSSYNLIRKRKIQLHKKKSFQLATKQIISIRI